MIKKIKYLICFGVLLSFSSTAQSTVLFNETDSVSHIVLPNVFTPNFDSINDVFRPYLDEITEMQFSIFNRYGNLIFETKNVRGFWDGRTTSGEPCKDGVYFCVLTATGVDGKKYKEKTFIQLFTNGFYK
ncbi:MAG: gliding motility-associated C-terminal domain-containing protein [Bacteroidia bacterium]|nr:gliding motility-associated C-terminal domain-containing protein [Bacteroidia bacterium]